MRFVLLVEGKTERKVLPSFLGRWVRQRLSRSIGVKLDEVSGLEDLKAKAISYLEGPDSAEIIAVIGLLDLYGFEEIQRESLTRDEFYRLAVDRIKSEVNHDSFCMYFAVHELEAWLFSEPRIFPSAVREALPAEAGSQPESIDFANHPSRLLREVWHHRTGKKYRKVIDGANLFAKLDPEVACAKCPHLKTMLDEMLELARAAQG